MTARGGIVRLSVNLGVSTAEALKSTAAREGLTLTESIRRAVSLWKFLLDERDRGRTVLLMEGEGKKASFREVVLP